jgi:Uma2 family endonuclease
MRHNEFSSMSVAAQKLTRDAFREMYAHRKPYYELLDGAAAKKSLPTRLHSILQFILSVMLKELGFKSRPELTLAIDETWEPTPDVCGILGPEEDPYPTHAVAVAIEVLSPDDRFTRVIQKCRQYAAWGIQDILVYDPVSRDVWYWDAVTGGLMESKETYRFRSQPVEIFHHEVFLRLENELRQP